MLRLLALVCVTSVYAATNLRPTPSLLTPKEIAQGFRSHTVLAKPLAAHRATIDDEETQEAIHVRQKFARFNGLRVIEIGNTETVGAALNRLRATGQYEFVEPDYVRSAQVEPNDPQFLDGSLWAFKNTGQNGGTAGADISAPAGWGIIHDAPNVIVAIVDSGLNLHHQDIAGNLWTNSSPTIGDVHGANFVGGNGAIVSGDPSDDEGHGTHVAGIIGAVGNNGLNVTGVAWQVQLMPLKALNSSGKGSDSDIVAAIDYAIAHGAKIINASYGADGADAYSQAEFTAISAARDAGVIFVAAAGNSSANLDLSRDYPANFALDNVLAVGASTAFDDVASFSNYGAAVDLFAPGEQILSLDYSSNTGTVLMSGTSMAAPEVAGALALIKAEFPNDTYRQLINRLLRGVDHPAKFASKAQTGGRLNLYGALTSTTNRPFNDDFASRPHYTTDNLAIRSSNVGATAESGEPAHAGATASATLWWEWTAQSSGNVSIDTSGSSYDTVLAVYTGTTLNALTTIAANDDDGSNTTSRVTFAAQAGTTYEIAVGGKGGAAGLTLLNVGTTPANDAFASPVTLSGQSTHVVASNAHCSREAGEPKILSFSGGASVWYQWTAPRTGKFQIAATSLDFDPIMAVYTGTSFSDLSLVSASDNTGTDNSQTGALCTINATAGVTYLITVDTKTASSVGQFTLSLVDSTWQAVVGDTVTGSPAVGSDGTVYVGSDDFSIYAFNPDGSQKWTYATGSAIDSCSPAIADDGSVYVGSFDGKLYAFTASGSLKWTHNFGGTTDAGSSPAIGPDGTIYLRVSDGYVHALNPADGSERWKANINTVNASFYGNPVVGTDGTVYQGSDENDHKMYAFTSDGAPKWTFTLDSGVYGAPAIDAAGNLYIVTLTGGVYSLAPDGTPRWHVTSGGNISSSVALSADGTTLYYGGYDHYLYARDTSNGAVRWQFQLGNEVRASSPAIDANGIIYIGCYDYEIYAVKPDGTLARTYDTGNIVRSAPAISGTRLYVGSNDHKLYAFDLSVGSAAGPWPQYRNTERRAGRSLPSALAITAQPQSQTAVIGLPLTLSVNAIGLGTLTYQWSKDGTAIAGATNATYTVSSVTSATAGSYTVVVTNSQGTVTSSAATVTVETANPGRLVNLSARTTAGTGAGTLIVGFVVTGSEAKPLIVRGVGPTLSLLGVTDPLADPSLQLLDSTNAVIAQNDDWSDPALPAKESSVGAFGLTSGSKDAALLATVTARNARETFTAHVIGANGTTGTALAEIYDLDPTAVGTTTSRLVNLSARAPVGTGGHILIAGFVISGNVPKQVLIRGVGPGLIPLGVSAADILANPRLDLYDHTNALYQSNDDWGGSATLSNAFQVVGAFGLATNSKDAALLVTLPPGAYTAQVSGVNSTIGVALVEVYEMP